MRTLAVMVCLVFIGVASTSANAQSRCWIDRVEKASNGVKIFFISHPLSGAVRKPGETAGEFFYHDTGRKLVIRRDEGLDHLFLPNGFEVSIYHLHSGCTLSVELGQDQTWLVGYGSNAMPGKSPQRTEVRIEARKRQP